jgi:hypothetical protein
MTSKGATIDVGAWLRDLGLGQYEATFRENAINEQVLPNLTAEDLKDVGIGIVGHRRMLLDAIGALPAGADAKPPTPSSTPLSTPPVAAASTPDSAGERRHVTVMFCDFVDSTGIAAKLDAEEWRDLVGVYNDDASAAVVEMGGKVAKKLGDPNQPSVTVVARTAPWRQTMIKAKTVLAFVIHSAPAARSPRSSGTG